LARCLPGVRRRQGGDNRRSRAIRQPQVAVAGQIQTFHQSHLAPKGARPNAKGASMPINILMPALSPTWRKATSLSAQEGGHKVKAATFWPKSNRQATMEYEAIDEGVIAEIWSRRHRYVAVMRLSVLAAEGEDVKTAVAALLR